MSLALFNAGAIEVIFDINNQPWFKRADLGRYLGIIKIRDSFTNFQAEFLKRREEILVPVQPAALEGIKIPLIYSYPLMVL